MADVLMPKLSDTMEEGKILRWLKRPGERIEEGEILVEVETDKADMEVEATAGGVLREIRLDEGESAQVGDVIAVIENGEAGRESTAAKQHHERSPDAADRPGVAEERAGDLGEEGNASEPPRALPRGAKQERASPRAVETTRAAPRAAPAVPKGKPRVSPLARSLAAELGVDPDGVPGTGPGGRVVRRDIEAAARVEDAGSQAPRPVRAEGSPPQERPAPPRPEETRAPVSPAAEPRTAAGTPVARPGARAPAASSSAGPAPEGMRRVPLTPMRASIARRMTQSKREAPHFYLNAVVDMDLAHALREQLRTSETVASVVTFNHMILKAAADALHALPELNARFAGDAVEVLAGIHVGVATAVPDGLIVPVIHDADRKSLVEIATAARVLAEKARTRSFSGDELSGATFTVSNLGMYGVESFAAVINPPQAAILAIGAVAERPFVRAGALVAAHTATLTLSCDHRAVDGARGAEFLRDVKARLENPARLLFPAAAADV